MVWIKPLVTEKQKLNNLLHDRRRRTKGDIFMMAGGWDRSGNVAMETSKGSSHYDFFSSWGKNPSLSFLPVCLPEWQNQNLEHSLSQVPFHPGLCWPDMQARDQEGSEFSRANVRCLWGTTPHSNHWLHEGENGKTWDALKTGSEMLWASVCGSLLGFLRAITVLGMHLLHLKVADAAAGLWMATYSIAARMVLLSLPKALLPQAGSLFIIFHEILFYLEVRRQLSNPNTSEGRGRWISASSWPAWST